jgi:hypothetical protein
MGYSQLAEEEPLNALNPDLTIRNAEQRDLDPMVRLLKILFDVEEDFQVDEKLQRSGLKMMLDAGSKRHCIKVVEMDGEVDTAALMPLCKMVAEASGQYIPPAQPVVGERVFSHESGIHCHAMLRDVRAYEPFSPDLAGHEKRRYMLGTHSGTAAIRHLLKEAGIRISAQQADALRPLLAKEVRSIPLPALNGIE